MPDLTEVIILMDPVIKVQADELFTGLGTDFSDAVNIFVRQCLLEGKIPFKYSSNKPINVETNDTIAAMLEAEKIANDSVSAQNVDIDVLLSSLLNDMS